MERENGSRASSGLKRWITRQMVGEEAPKKGSRSAWSDSFGRPPRPCGPAAGGRLAPQRAMAAPLAHRPSTDPHNCIIRSPVSVFVTSAEHVTPRLCLEDVRPTALCNTFFGGLASRVATLLRTQGWGSGTGGVRLLRRRTVGAMTYRTLINHLNDIGVSEAVECRTA